ncbi:MAG: hypothetical protein Q8Q13_01105, partial [bacterium]|nr:hypothetical protein [bacterium]
MKTGYKQSLVMLALIVLVIPHVALAAWWNPFTWKIFISNKAPRTQVQQVPNATTTQATSTTKTVAAPARGKVKVTSDESSVIESLKKQVADLTQKVNQPNQPKVEALKTSILTLPSGTVVETDANGNIIRTVKDVPPQTYRCPNATTVKCTTGQAFVPGVTDSNGCKLQDQCISIPQSSLDSTGSASKSVVTPAPKSLTVQSLDLLSITHQPRVGFGDYLGAFRANSKNGPMQIQSITLHVISSTSSLALSNVTLLDISRASAV